MCLFKEVWSDLDKLEFQNYLYSLRNESKQEFTRKIANTNYEVLAIPTPKLKHIAKEIAKGNFLSFLDLNITDTYENLMINGFLIAKIKNFEEFEKRLYNYGKIVDSWACCDIMKFNLNDENKFDFLKLSERFISDKHTYTRRIGVILWFSLLKFDDCFSYILNLINKLKNEKEYYVNMALGWFLSESFVKRREETLKLFETTALNTFTTNKAIQKIRESFRVSNDDKQMLLKYKK